MLIYERGFKQAVEYGSGFSRRRQVKVPVKKTAQTTWDQSAEDTAWTNGPVKVIE